MCKKTLAAKFSTNKEITLNLLDSNFTDAKIGDKVTYLNSGFGEIIDMNRDSKYPIACQIKDSTFTFTLDGRFSIYDTIPSLIKGHHAEIILCVEVKNKLTHIK